MSAALIAVAFAFAVIVLVFYVTRPRRVFAQSTAAPSDHAAAAAAAAALAGDADVPPPGSTGFGSGMGSRAALDANIAIQSMPTPACSTLYRKPVAAEAAAPSMNSFFAPTSEVPKDVFPKVDCTEVPMKPLSSSIPLADIPACLLAPVPPRAAE